MQIELYIDDEKRIFTAPFVPMLAKRKYLSIESQVERRLKEDETATTGYTLEEFDEMCTILSDIVFRNKFTVKELMSGASEEYVMGKIVEAVFGIKQKKKKEDDEGNNQGE